MGNEQSQGGGLGGFFKRWGNGDLLERHRRNKVADFWDRLLPLIDPDGNRDEPPKNGYTDTVRKQAAKYINKTMSPEDFDQMVKSELERNQHVSEADLTAAIAQMRRPALFLSKMPTRGTPGARGCWLGGLPNLPANIDWPWCRHQDKDVVPMHFVAQIDLSQMPRDPSFPPMPETGTLFFFVTKVAHHILYHPEILAKVIYVAGDVSQTPVRPMPQMPDFSGFEGAKDWAHYYEDVTKGPLSQWNFDFLPFDDVHVPQGGNNAVWRARTTAGSKAADHVRAVSAVRVKDATVNDDAGGTDAPLHQMFGCKTSGNAGGETLLLSLETDDDILFEDQYIQGVQFHFETIEARNAFDLSKVHFMVESS